MSNSVCFCAWGCDCGPGARGVGDAGAGLLENLYRGGGHVRGSGLLCCWSED